MWLLFGEKSIISGAMDSVVSFEYVREHYRLWSDWTNRLLSFQTTWSLLFTWWISNMHNLFFRVTEETFWRNYFYRVSLIKQSTQLTSLAQQTGQWILFAWGLSSSKMVLPDNPNYWGTLSTYHTCPKIWNKSFYYVFICLKYCCINGKQCRPWSETAFRGIRSGSTLFAKAYLAGPRSLVDKRVDS